VLDGIAQQCRRELGYDDFQPVNARFDYQRIHRFEIDGRYLRCRLLVHLREDLRPQQPYEIRLSGNEIHLAFSTALDQALLRGEPTAAEQFYTGVGDAYLQMQQIETIRSRAQRFLALRQFGKQRHPQARKWSGALLVPSRLMRRLQLEDRLSAQTLVDILSVRDGLARDRIALFHRHQEALMTMGDMPDAIHLRNERFAQSVLRAITLTWRALW